MADKSHLDGNLTTSNLICRNLLDEAVEAQKELEGVTKELRRCQRHGTVDKSKLDVKGALSKLRKVAYNLRADLETFINAFVKREGIKDIMMLIEECQ